MIIAKVDTCYGVCTNFKSYCSGCFVVVFAIIIIFAGPNVCKHLHAILTVDSSG